MNINYRALDILVHECPIVKEHLKTNVNKGMGYLLNAAGGGPNWKVNANILHGGATTLLRIFYLNLQTDEEVYKELNRNYHYLTQEENIASKNLATKVLLSMRYESCKSL